jgi:hypothetical protein
MGILQHLDKKLAESKAKARQATIQKEQEIKAKQQR